MAGRGLPRGLTPLRHRGFRLLAGGQLTSNVGDALYMVALPWYVLAEHGGALLLGTVLAAYGIPRTVLLAVGGQASDRWRPWTVMMAADTVRMVAVAALAVATVSGPASAVVLVPIAVVLGAGEGLFLPGSMAIAPALLPGDDLQAGNALLAGGTQLATLAGPLVGGVIVAFFGPAPAFAIDAATFAVSALTLVGVRATQRTAPGAAPAGQPEPAAVALADAGNPGPTLRSMLRSEPILQVGLLVTVAANLGSGGLGEVALPSLAHGPLHSGAGGYGALIAALGGGALVGTIVAGQARQARRPLVVGTFAFLVAAVAMAAVPYVGSTVAVGLLIAVFGVMEGFGNVVTITAVQRWAPPQVMGRLMGVLVLASMGLFPVSVALAGFVVHDLGPAPFFPFASATLALAVLVALTQRTWRDFGMAPAATGSSDTSPPLETLTALAPADPGRDAPAAAPADTTDQMP
ncbi:MAG TPA: MFS transporter [Streptosporangiaceae bacterium]|nr:MFS transporter [Streptosporangiaceae bacterium]